MALLEVSNLGIAFGGLQAVAQLDLSIEKGHLYGLIGPNGAGKTTVFNLLTGVYKPDRGQHHPRRRRTSPARALIRSTRPASPVPSRISACSTR